jgi:hypothetical protein
MHIHAKAVNNENDVALVRHVAIVSAAAAGLSGLVATAHEAVDHGTDRGARQRRDPEQP